MRLTVRRVYDFGVESALVGDDLLSPGAWDAARETTGPFGLAAGRAEWEQAARDPDLGRRAADVVRVAEWLEAGSVCSHGVGTGLLELNVHRLAPRLRFVCTDYAPRATRRLAEFFTEADVRLHDLVRDPPPTADLYLMHRLDTELGDDDWREVFGRHTAPILFVPTILLGLRRAAREVVRRVLRGGTVNAGWFRSEDALRALWSRTHTDRREVVGESTAFLLLPR